MDTSKSFRGLKIRFYASTRVPLKTRNVFDIVGFDVEVEVEDDACFIIFYVIRSNVNITFGISLESFLLIDTTEI